MIKVEQSSNQIEQLQGLSVYSWRGLTEHPLAIGLQRQIVEKSTQAHLKHTDDANRFATESAYREWVRKGRVLYVMTNAAFDLAGLIWFGQKRHDDTNHDLTFAIRLYEGYHGRHLAKPFMELAHDHVQTHYFPTSTGFWLEVEQANRTALALYNSFGYVAVQTQQSSDTLLMEYAGTRRL